MRIHFHGAAGQVTGSMHLVEAAGKRVLLDCGMQQGSREMEAANAGEFPFDPARIDAGHGPGLRVQYLARTQRGGQGPVAGKPEQAIRIGGKCAVGWGNVFHGDHWLRRITRQPFKPDEYFHRFR